MEEASSGSPNWILSINSRVMTEPASEKKPAAKARKTKRVKEMKEKKKPSSVHRPARPASWTHKKLASGTYRKQAVKVIERVDKQKVDELMGSYLRLLSETEVHTYKLCIVGQNIEEGIVDLIARHNIKWFVMGSWELHQICITHGE